MTRTSFKARSGQIAFALATLNFVWPLIFLDLHTWMLPGIAAPIIFWPIAIAWAIAAAVAFQGNQFWWMVASIPFALVQILLSGGVVLAALTGDSL